MRRRTRRRRTNIWTTKNQKILRNRPDITPFGKAGITRTICEDLYHPLLKYWNRQLLKLIELNTRALGRHEKEASEFFLYGFYYDGKSWYVDGKYINHDGLPMVYEEDEVDILQMHPSMNLEKVAKVTNTITELDKEHKKVKRLLGNFLLLNVPAEKTKNMLGNALYKYLEKFNYPSLIENHLYIKEEADTYLKEHDEFIKKLQKRVMMSILVQDLNDDEELGEL